MRRLQSVLGVLVAVAGITAMCVWGPLLYRLPKIWVLLILLGLIVLHVLAWYWIVRPHQLREARLDDGLCANCGYDPRGDLSAVCPECGEMAHDCP